MRKNPVREAREELGLSEASFCLLYGVPTGTLRNVEYGFTTKIYKPVLEGFKKADVDIEELQDEYREWLLEKANAELESAKKR